MKRKEKKRNQKEIKKKNKERKRITVKAFINSI